MYHYTIEQWVFLFYLYCFLGWCYETAYVSIKKRQWENRGFMRGPFLPLYGSGAIMMLVVSSPFTGNLLLTYIAGCIGATILEFITGATMESLFKFRYWDYSDMRCNYKGYICLRASLFWGVLTILMTRLVQEPIGNLVLQIPQTTLSVVVLILTIGITVDFVVSFRAALDLRDLLIKLEETRIELAKAQEKMVGVMENVSTQVRAAMGEKKEQAGSVLTEIAGLRETAPAELITKWEEMIRSVTSRMNDSDSESMKAAREEYHLWKRKWEESKSQRESIARMVNPKRLFQFRKNSALKSNRFTEALTELRDEVKNRRQQNV